MKSGNNATIGFSLYIIHQKEKFEFSSNLFELIELEGLFSSLSKEVTVLDLEDSMEALRQIKFQTEYLKVNNRL